MSEAYFHFSADQTLPDALTEMPAPVKAFLQRGFGAMVLLDPAARATLMDLGLKALESPSEAPQGDASKLGIEQSDYPAAVGAATFAILAFVGNELKPTEFVSALQRAGIIDTENADEVLSFVQLLLRERARIETGVSSIRTGRAVLPTLHRVEWAADLRAREDNSTVPQLIPVGIIRLGTDHRTDELFCQATLSQLDYVLEELNKLRNRLIALNDWQNARASV